jgi:beta-galactosidase
VPDGFPVPRAVLRFDGVDSCFAVWLNGVRLGDGKGSRLPTEFDVSGTLRPGQNVLAVRVHQWSAGSYLEDQDMWWLSGIFRPVRILARGLADFFVQADFDPRRGRGTLAVQTSAPARLSVPELGLAGADPAGPHVIEDVEPWSDERPRLYAGEIVAGEERIAVRIGFRSVAVVAGVLTVNGTPILLRGVNRHEWDPRTGRTLTPETMLADVLAMKRHNVNAVRTSHYPPDPRFLDLCDRHGLWVIDECDLETHGFAFGGWRGNPSDDPAWRAAARRRAWEEGSGISLRARASGRGGPSRSYPGGEESLRGANVTRETVVWVFRTWAVRTLRWEQRSEVAGRPSRLAAGCGGSNGKRAPASREARSTGVEQVPEDETPGASPGRNRPGRSRGA